MEEKGGKGGGGEKIKSKSFTGATACEGGLVSEVAVDLDYTEGSERKEGRKSQSFCRCRLRAKEGMGLSKKYQRATLIIERLIFWLNAAGAVLARRTNYRKWDFWLNTSGTVLLGSTDYGTWDFLVEHCWCSTSAPY